MAAAADFGFARDYAAIANAYAKEAAADLHGEKFCKWVHLAARRHLNDLKRFKGKKAAYYFDAWQAGDVCDFIEKLPHVESQWATPNITLKAVQVFILAVIFGWRRRSDGRRRFSYVYIEMARKGAKSTLTSGVCLYCLTCEGEVGPQIIIGATTAEQAGKVFNPAKSMVRRTPDLREEFGLKDWARSISCAQNDGYIQTIAARGKTQDGWNPHVCVLDELHAHESRALFDVMVSSQGSRDNPLFWIITTAGFSMAGVCYEQRQFVTKVLEGALEAEHVFGIIFTLDQEERDANNKIIRKADDPFDESKWIKANPMLGVTPPLRRMQELAALAKASPASEGNFKTKNLNIWLGAASAWLNIEQWKRWGDAALSWDEFEGLECYIGGDLADKNDITAAVLAAIDKQDRLIFKPVFWLPEDVLKDPEHAQGKSVVPYRQWADEGHLRLTAGDWVDHNEVEQQIRDWKERYGARKAVFDQFAAAQAMASRLNEDYPDEGGFASILHKKASNVTDCAKDLEARVKSPAGRMRHDANPVMTWMASNAVVQRRKDETLLPVKETPMSKNKIDGIDALLNAMFPFTTFHEEDGTLDYEPGRMSD